MDYQVSYFEKSWHITGDRSTAGLIEDIIDTRDDAIKQLRLPPGQEGNVDYISCGVWLKARTDRPQRSNLTTAFSSARQDGLHRPGPFSYIRKPLEETEFRLLELTPGASAEPLRGRLNVFKFHAAPKYYALSYVWGPVQGVGSIVLGDGLTEQQPLRQNLHAALCWLRNPDESRYVWVDALCIDQGNVAEASQQVQMMGTIFSNAAKVAISLGEATEHSKFGLQLLQQIIDGRAYDEPAPWMMQPPEVVRRGLTNILTRPWFNRIWTVQESALSNNSTIMFCSDGSFCEWSASAAGISTFMRGLKYAAVSSAWAENGFAGSDSLGITAVDLSGIITLLNQQLTQCLRRYGNTTASPVPDLLDIAYEVKDKHCTDVRDRLYAILGLALIRGVQLQPDYSLSHGEVHDAFRHLVREAALEAQTHWALVESGHVLESVKRLKRDTASGKAV